MDDLEDFMCLSSACLSRCKDTQKEVFCDRIVPGLKDLTVERFCVDPFPAESRDDVLVFALSTHKDEVRGCLWDLIAFGETIDDLVLESVRKDVAVGDAKDVVLAIERRGVFPAKEKEINLFKGRVRVAEEDFVWKWNAFALVIESEDEIKDLVWMLEDDQVELFAEHSAGLKVISGFEGGEVRSLVSKDRLKSFSKIFDLFFAATIGKSFRIVDRVDEIGQFDGLSGACRRIDQLQHRDDFLFTSFLIDEGDEVVDLGDREEVEKVILSEV